MKSIFLDASEPYARAIFFSEGNANAEVSVRTRPLKGIHNQIDMVTKLVGCELNEMDAISVSIGPGSWTGIHIALTTARTLCQALGKALVPVNSLELLAWENIERSVCYSMVDARHGHVYCAKYEIRDGVPTEIEAPAKLPFEEVLSSSNKHIPTTFAGSGAEVHKAAIVGASSQYCLGRNTAGAQSIAKSLNACAHRALGVEEAMAVEPLYLIPEGEGPQQGAWKK